MAGEDVGDSSGDLDEALERWLDDKAEELDLSRTELLARLRNGDSPEHELADDFGDVPAVEAELEDLREEFDGKIEDVRERIIQIKRESDGKAPADHDHADLRRLTEEVAARTDELAAELESVSEGLEELEGTVDTGFDNFEDVLEYLTDATDDVEEKLTTLAEVTVDLRDRARALTARETARAAADELATLANRRGIAKAKCSHCDGTVHVGLLAEPKCPHCASTFNDVEPKQGLFGSHRLVVGDPPALEGERADWDLRSVAEGEDLDPGDVLSDIVGGEDDE